MLAGTETVSELAREHEVSRKFLYQQVHTAQRAFDSAFAPVPRLLPAGYQVLAATTGPGLAIARPAAWSNPYRISLGTVHNIVHSPVLQARFIGLLDEIFQRTIPFWWGSIPNPPSASCYLGASGTGRPGLRSRPISPRGSAHRAPGGSAWASLPR